MICREIECIVASYSFSGKNKYFNFIILMDALLVFKTSLYFLALINPASKIIFISSLCKEKTPKEIVDLSIKSTIVAFFILVILGVAGKFILENVFHVEIYSLKIAGGIILFMVGLLAVRNGVFYNMESTDKFDNLSVVPLAAPLIAGPGTIAAIISFSSQIGIPITLISLTIGLTMNLVFMLLSNKIGAVLERLYVTGPIIRITGLIVATVSVQMILSGVGEWAVIILAQS